MNGHWTDFLDPDGPIGRYLDWSEVAHDAGLSRTTAWRLRRAGEFPDPYSLSAGRVGYREPEIEAWKRWRAHHRAAPPDRRSNGRPQCPSRPTESSREPALRSTTAKGAPPVTSPASEPPPLFDTCPPTLPEPTGRRRGRKDDRERGQFAFDF